MSHPLTTAIASSRRRWMLTLAVVLIPVALLALAVPEAIRKGSIAELPCWVLPNLQVMAAPGNEECPIGARQRIARADLEEMTDINDRATLREVLQRSGARVRLELQEGARKQWVDAPVHLTARPTRLARIGAAAVGVALLLGIPLFLVWRSSSRAASPLAAFYGCVSVVLVTITAGQHSDGMTRVALLALVLAPAAATHLSLVFPRERQLIRDVPAFVGVPYTASAFLIPVGWMALERDPILWPAFVSLLVALTAGAWAVLILSCRFAVWESRSPIERARAKLVLYAALLVPLVPTLLLALDAQEGGQIALDYLWSAAITMPLPIAVAIGRYNLFDLESEVRHAIARILYLGLAAFVVTLVLVGVLIGIDARPALREPALLFLLASVCVVLVEALRSRTLGVLEALVTPRLQRLRRVREAFERSVTNQWDGDEVASLLLHALNHGIAPRCGCVLLAAPDAWRPVHAFGREPPGTDAVGDALRLLGARSLLHLAASSALQEEAATLVASGVEAVVAIESGGERHGLLLFGAPEKRGPFTGLELDFAVGLAAQAGIALRNARITAGLIATERHAATGRVAIGLAHDVGKDLGWMRRLVKRLPEQIDDPERLVRDTSMLHELTDGLAGAIERFVRDATEAPDATVVVRQLEEIVEDAARRAARLHGEGRVTQNLDRELRDFRVHESLGRAIWNLLDNALHASADGKPVHVVATREDDSVQIEIEDQGCGIGEHSLARVFEPGFTTRAQAGGSGVGLPVALEIVESLGGTLELYSSLRGTRARIRVPAMR